MRTFTGSPSVFPGSWPPSSCTRGRSPWTASASPSRGSGADRFDIQVVPYTMQHTNLSRAQIRDRVNLECDMVGKYVVRAAELAGLDLSGVRPGEVTH